MKSLIVGALCLLGLVGCGGPLEEDGAPVGASQQELVALQPVAPLNPNGDNGGAQINTNLVRNPQEAVVQPLQFQNQMHLTNPISRGDGSCGH